MRLHPCLFAALTLATPLPAQETSIANGTAIGNWIVRCDAVSTTQTACAVQQTHSVTETGAVVVNFLAVPNGPENAVLIAQVPMGVYLPGGAVYRAANDETAPQTTMIWQRCANDLCEAAIVLTPADLEGFTDAGTLLFGYQMQPDSDAVILSVDVATLATAIAAIRP